MLTRAQEKPAVERDSCALYVAPSVSVSDADIEAGFRWLENWDVAMPFKSYERLAEDFVHESCSLSESKGGQGLLTVQVRDLRQMVYDERVLFVRHGSSADGLLAARAAEDCEDADCPLPMLRAIWIAKPLLLALPESWVVEGVPA